MDVRAAQGVSHTRNHWNWQPGWGVGTRYYAWHLTFEHCHEVFLLAERLRPALAHSAVQDVVPDAWLHLTMTGIGFADDVSQHQLDQIRDLVFAQLPDITDGVLTLDAVQVDADGVVLLARPDGWLLELLGVQRRAVEKVVGPVDWDYFRPHVSLSYCNGGQPVERLVADLAQSAPPQPSLVVSRPRITLLELNRDSRQYQWRVLAQRMWE